MICLCFASFSKLFSCTPPSDDDFSRFDSHSRAYSSLDGDCNAGSRARPPRELSNGKAGPRRGSFPQWIYLLVRGASATETAGPTLRARPLPQKRTSAPRMGNSLACAVVWPGARRCAYRAAAAV